MTNEKPKLEIESNMEIKLHLKWNGGSEVLQIKKGKNLF